MDPLRSGAIFKVTDVSKLRYRSPPPSTTKPKPMESPQRVLSPPQDSSNNRIREKFDLLYRATPIPKILQEATTGDGASSRMKSPFANGELAFNPYLYYNGVDISKSIQSDRNAATHLSSSHLPTPPIASTAEMDANLTTVTTTISLPDSSVEEDVMARDQLLEPSKHPISSTATEEEPKKELPRNDPSTTKNVIRRRVPISSNSLVNLPASRPVQRNDPNQSAALQSLNERAVTTAHRETRSVTRKVPAVASTEPFPSEGSGTETENIPRKRVRRQRLVKKNEVAGNKSVGVAAERGSRGQSRQVPIVPNDWSADEMKSLYAAFRDTSPTSPDFWDLVSAYVNKHAASQRTADECSEKWFEYLKVAEDKRKARLQKKIEKKSNAEPPKKARVTKADIKRLAEESAKSLREDDVFQKSSVSRLLAGSISNRDPNEAPRKNVSISFLHSSLAKFFTPDDPPNETASSPVASTSSMDENGSSDEESGDGDKTFVDKSSDWKASYVHKYGKKIAAGALASSLNSSAKGKPKTMKTVKPTAARTIAELDVVSKSTRQQHNPEDQDSSEEMMQRRRYSDGLGLPYEGNLSEFDED